MKADDFACSGCCAHFDSKFDVTSTDYPPGDPGHDDDARYWCEKCFLAHQDGHPGNLYMQQHCSPEMCPTYNGVWAS